MLAYVPPDILTWHCFMQIKMRNVIHENPEGV